MNLADWHMLLRSVIALGVVLLAMVAVLYGLKHLQSKLAHLNKDSSGHPNAGSPQSIPKITSRIPLDMRRQLIGITWGETEILLLVANTSETVLATRTIPTAAVEQPQTTPPS